eukprot:250454_1
MSILRSSAVRWPFISIRCPCIGCCTKEESDDKVEEFDSLVADTKNNASLDNNNNTAHLIISTHLQNISKSTVPTVTMQGSHFITPITINHPNATTPMTPLMQASPFILPIANHPHATTPMTPPTHNRSSIEFSPLMRHTSPAMQRLLGQNTPRSPLHSTDASSFALPPRARMLIQNNNSKSFDASTKSTSTIAGFPLHCITVCTPPPQKGHKAGKETYCFVEDSILGTGQFGTVYEAYQQQQNQTKVAIKITPAVTMTLHDRDASHEYILSQKISRKQRISKLNNLIDIRGWCRRRKEKVNEYVIVMDYYPGSLYTLLDTEVNAHLLDIDSSYSVAREMHATILTINLLKQCANGLKQLRMVQEDLQYNDWSPNNIMVTDMRLPVNNEAIVYKLADFGKARAGSQFGTALYASNVDSPLHQETTDLNSIAVIGLEMLSVFGSTDNALWEAIKSLASIVISGGYKVVKKRDVMIKRILRDYKKER